MKSIIFSAPMIQALKEGRKAMTRRIVKCSEVAQMWPYCDVVSCYDFWPDLPVGSWYLSNESNEFECINPKYSVGEIIYVKETWCHKFDDRGYVYNEEGNLDSSCVHYAADGYHVDCCDGDGFKKYNKDGSESSPWRSPLFMPEWASRFKLLITGVKCERIQDITVDDAIAEGICIDWTWPENVDSDGEYYTEKEKESRAIEAFQELWESIHGPESWEINPWVWVYEFKVLHMSESTGEARE